MHVSKVHDHTCMAYTRFRTVLMRHETACVVQLFQSANPSGADSAQCLSAPSMYCLRVRMICIITPLAPPPLSRRPISPAPFDACSIKLVQTVACLEKFANKYVELLNILKNVQNKRLQNHVLLFFFLLFFCFVLFNFSYFFFILFLLYFVS